MIAAILKLPTVYFDTLIALITALGAWEWSALIEFKALFLRALFVVMIIIGLYLLWINLYTPNILAVTAMGMALGLIYWIWISFAVLCFNIGKHPLGLEMPSLRIVSGIVFFIAGFLAIIAVRSMLLHGAQWLLAMILIIMATDSGAYFCGRFFGKTLMAKRVSPKKTWAGFWGGLLIALIASIITTYCFGLAWPQSFAFWCLSLVAAFFSMVGDLSISVMKRQAGVKDSGRLLPGHGGFLDRMDSVYAGMVIFAFGFLWL